MKLIICHKKRFVMTCNRCLLKKDMKKHIICHIKNVIYVAHIYHGKDRPDGKQTKTRGT